MAEITRLPSAQVTADELFEMARSHFQHNLPMILLGYNDEDQPAAYYWKNNGPAQLWLLEQARAAVASFPTNEGEKRET